jgi:hypothetical protein
MKIRYLLAALLLGLSLATPATARERTHKSVTRAPTHGIEGHEIAAPPWSAACMTDHGPSECGEPMWIYRSSDASLSPETADAQEYPWCVSRESYLYCFYRTQEQCQWTASGIGGCALNPRLLFPNKPRDSNARATNPYKTY